MKKAATDIGLSWGYLACSKSPNVITFWMWMLSTGDARLNLDGKYFLFRSLSYGGEDARKWAIKAYPSSFPDEQYYEIQALYPETLSNQEFWFRFKKNAPDIDMLLFRLANIVAQARDEDRKNALIAYLYEDGSLPPFLQKQQSRAEAVKRWIGSNPGQADIPMLAI